MENLPDPGKRLKSRARAAVRMPRQCYRNVTGALTEINKEEIRRRERCFTDETGALFFGRLVRTPVSVGCLALIIRAMGAPCTDKLNKRTPACVSQMKQNAALHFISETKQQNFSPAGRRENVESRTFLWQIAQKPVWHAVCL